jgi:hypothetical protein
VGSTGVAKKELNIVKLMTEKAARLDRETFGVDGAHGPWHQRLAEIGDIKPLAFGHFGEMGPGLEALLASAAKRGADEMADRYLIENARRQSECRCSTCGSAGEQRSGGRKRRSSLVD